MPLSLDEIFGGRKKETISAPKGKTTDQEGGSSESLFSYIDQYSTEYPSVPPGLLKSLAVQESGAGKNMTSVNNPGRGKAKGPYQFIDDTARSFIPGWRGPQDSYDFDKSTRGAYQYLNNLIERTGSLEKALIRYHGREVDATKKDSWSYAEDILRRAGVDYNPDIIEQDKREWEQNKGRKVISTGGKARTTVSGARNLSDIFSGVQVDEGVFDQGIDQELAPDSPESDDYSLPETPTPFIGSQEAPVKEDFHKGLMRGESMAEFGQRLRQRRLGQDAPKYSADQTIQMPEVELTPLKRAPGTETIPRPIQRAQGAVLGLKGEAQEERARLLEEELDPIDGMTNEELKEYQKSVKRGEQVADKLGDIVSSIQRFGAVPVIPASSPAAKKAREIYGKDADRKLQDLYSYLHRQNIEQRQEEATVFQEKAEKTAERREEVDPIWLRLEEMRDKVYRTENNQYVNPALMRGDANLAADLLGSRIMFSGQDDKINDVLNIRRRLNEISDKQKPQKGIARILDNTVEMLPAMGKGAALSMIPYVGPLLSQSMWAQQGAGSMYLDMVENGVSPDNAKKIAIPAGITYAFIEGAQVGKILNTAKKAALKKTLQKSMKKKIAQLAKEKGKDWAKELNEEVLQGVIEGMVVDAGKYLEGENLPESKDMLKKIGKITWETIKEAGPSLGILSGAGAAAGAAQVISDGADAQLEVTDEGEAYAGPRTDPKKDYPGVKPDQEVRISKEDRRATIKEAMQGLGIPDESIPQAASEKAIDAEEQISDEDIQGIREAFQEDEAKRAEGVKPDDEQIGEAFTEEEIQETQEEVSHRVDEQSVSEEYIESVDKGRTSDYVITKESEGEIGDPNYKEYPKRINKTKFGDFEITDENQRDELSGLPNQGATTKYIERVRGDNWLAEIDGDEFKSVNDTQGHGEGDRVIGLIGQIAEEYFPDKFVGRKGGEEFHIDFGETFTAEDKKKLVAMHNAIPKRIRVAGAPFTVSVGVGKGSSKGRGLEDEALYEAKKEGRNIIGIANENGITFDTIKGKDVGKKQYAKDKRAQVIEQYADEAFEEGEINEQQRDSIREAADNIRRGKGEKVFEQPGRAEEIRRVEKEEGPGEPKLPKAEGAVKKAAPKASVQDIGNYAGITFENPPKQGDLEAFKEKVKSVTGRRPRWNSARKAWMVKKEELPAVRDALPEYFYNAPPVEKDIQLKQPQKEVDDAKEIRADERRDEKEGDAREEGKDRGGEGVRGGVEGQKRGGEKVAAQKKEKVTEGKSNEHLGERVKDKPEGEPAGDVQKPEEQREAKRVGEKPREAGGRPIRGADRQRAEGERGRGKGDERVPDDTAGRLDYRITPDDNIGSGGEMAHYRDNVAAIKTLKKIEEEGRSATLAEQKVFVRYLGWGGLANAFKENDKRYQELKNLLTEDEYNAARRSTQNAHYTAPEVATAMWDAIAKMGFNGGRVLEPATGGSGIFLGTRPNIPNMTLYGVELDPLSARIASQLYQNAKIANKGYQEVRMQKDAYSVMISNVPFSDFKVREKKDAKTPGLDPGHSLHDFYFLKSLYGLKPGGIMAYVTSRYTMDKRDSGVRKKISEQADLLGAIRLPKTAFKGIANTDVVTDVIFLQKRLPGEEASDLTKQFLGRKEVQIGDNAHPINEYYVNNPDMVIGEHSAAGSMYRAEEYTVELPKGISPKEYHQRLNDAFSLLPTGVMNKAVDSKTEEMQQDLTENYEGTPFEDLPYGSYAIDPMTGDVVQKNVVTGKVESQKKLPEATYKRIKGMVKIKNAAKKLFAAQRRGEDHLSKLKALNAAYDRFVKENGFLSQLGNVRAMRGDPDAALLLSLENWDRNKKTATKADVLSGVTMAKVRPPDRAKTDVDALAISLMQYGGINQEYMAKLRDADVEDVVRRLLDQGAVFEDPVSNNLIVSDAYLSGNIRQKLRIAKEAAEKDGRYNRNVEELQKVMPVDLEPADITIRLNSPVLEQSDVEQFITELVEPNRLSVTYVPISGRWNVNGSAWGAKATEVYGTGRADALAILEKLLNDRPIIIKNKLRDGSEIVDQEATNDAQARADAIKREFEEWIWKDNDRAQRIARKYNEEFNAEVPRTYTHPARMVSPDADVWFDGSAFPYPARKHQADAVWRQIQNSETMLAHVVGSGKTLEMVWAGMEMKRLGLRKKPMYVVPNHMLVQFTKEFYQAYPAAKILMATEADFQKSRRRLLMNKVATGEWDAVVVTQSQFELLPVSKEYEISFLKNMITEYENYLKSVDKERKKARSIKDLEKAKGKMEARLDTLMDSVKDEGVIPFDDLGVDQLFVDEADMFKNLEYKTTLQGVRGLGKQKGSQQAFDMLMKVRHMQNIGGGVTFATGTPISNTLVEAYSMMRYLQPDVLKRLNIESFDAWRRMFAQEVTQVELSNTGTKYVPVTRFSKIVNVPELMKLLRQVWDIKTAKSLEEDRILLPGKQLPYSTIKNVAAPATPYLKSYLKHLERREAALSGKAEKGSDNVLVIIGDGKKAALDLRMIHETLPDNPKSKLNIAVDKMVELYNDYKKQRYTSAVFIDQPRAKRGGIVFFDAVQDMKKKLIARGVKEDEIAIAQEAKTHLQRQELFDKVRKGKVRIIFGSTQKMGAGTNFQDNLKAILHLDAPWRPRDIEQRNGRGVRSGNKTGEVEIFNFVTKGSLDTGIWSVLETKAKAIETIMTGKDQDVRESEEDYFGSAKELSVDNPLMKESMELRNDIKKLEGSKRAFIKQMTRANALVQGLPQSIEDMKNAIEKHKEDRSALPKEPKGENFEMTVGGKTYKKATEAGDALLKKIKAMGKTASLSKEEVIGRFAGMKMGAAITGDGVRVTLHAKNFKYNTTIKIEDATPAGVVAKVRNSVYKSLPDIIDGKSNRLEQMGKDLEENKKLAKKKFEKNDELLQKEARLKQVMTKLEEEAKKEDQAKDDTSKIDWKALSATDTEDIYTVDEEDDGDYDALEARVWDVDMPTEPKTSNRVNKTQIIRYIEKAWGAAVRNKGLERFRDAARYYPKKVLIRLRKWGEIEPLTHELAHHIDHQMRKRLGTWWKTKGAKEVKPILNELKGLDYDQKKRRTKEGFAEFMRYYLTTDKAQEKAPKFYNFFVSSFLQLNPDEAARLKKLKGLIDTWQNQGALARIEQQIDKRGEHTDLPKSERVSRMKKDFYSNWVDSLYPLKQKVEQVERIIGRKLKPTEDPYKMAVYYNQKASAITNTMVKKYMMDPYGNRVGKSLKEILEPIRPQDMEIFVSYAAARRAKLLHDRGIESGMETSDVNHILEQYKSETWDKVSDDITEWSNHLINWLVHAGSLSKDDANKIRKMNPVYIPFKRAFIDYADEVYRRGKAGLGGGTDGGQGIHKIKGSGRPIIDPLQSLVMQATEVVSKAHKVHIARLVADLAENEGLGGLVTKVPAPSRAVQFNVGQIQGQLEKIGYETPEGDLDNILTVFTAGMSGGKDNVVSIWKDGERQYYELDPELYGILKSLDMPKSENFMWLFRFLGKFSRGIRLGATGLNPAFGLYRNPVRDIQTHAMQSKLGEVEGKRRIAEAFGRAITKKKTRLEERFEAAGGSMVGIMGFDRAQTRKAYDEILANKLDAAGKTLYVARHPGIALDVLRDIFSFTEMVPRSAELSGMYEKYRAENPEWADEDCFVAAFNDAQDVTVNFTRSGRIGRYLNMVIPFFNASIQGTDKAYRSLKSNPTRYVLRGLAYLAVPASMLHWYNMDEEWYKDLPLEYKYSNLFVPAPGTGEVVRVPIPFEAGAVFISLPQAMLDNSSYGSDAWKAWSRVMAKNLPDFMPAAFGPVVDVWKNKNFLGKPIEHKGLQYLPSTDRTTRWTTEHSKLLSNGFNSVGIEWSPVQIDYLIAQYTGGLSRRLAVRPIKEPSDIPVLGDVLLRGQGVPRRQLDKFWDRYDKLQKIWNAKRGDMSERLVTEYDQLKMFKRSYSNYYAEALRNAKESGDDELRDELYASMRNALFGIGIK